MDRRELDTTTTRHTQITVTRRTTRTATVVSPCAPANRPLGEEAGSTSRAMTDSDPEDSHWESDSTCVCSSSATSSSEEDSDDDSEWLSSDDDRHELAHGSSSGLRGHAANSPNHPPAYEPNTDPDPDLDPFASDWSSDWDSDSSSSPSSSSTTSSSHTPAPTAPTLLAALFRRVFALKDALQRATALAVSRFQQLRACRAELAWTQRVGEASTRDLVARVMALQVVVRRAEEDRAEAERASLGVEREREEAERRAEGAERGVRRAERDRDFALSTSLEWMGRFNDARREMDGLRGELRRSDEMLQRERRGHEATRLELELTRAALAEEAERAGRQGGEGGVGRARRKYSEDRGR